MNVFRKNKNNSKLRILNLLKQQLNVELTKFDNKKVSHTLLRPIYAIIKPKVKKELTLTIIPQQGK